ncbi:MAG: hypothetical protein OZ929_17990 [Bryobacterales bacterium]|nr:hypothetical protein [Bryobacterales bacterium]
MVTGNGATPAVRLRAMRMLGYLLWIASGAFAVIALAAWFSLMDGWIRFLASVRRSLGFTVPPGPDWLLIAGLAAGIAVPVVALIGIYAVYMRSWRKRLDVVWAGVPVRVIDTRVHPLESVATEKELAARYAYLRALVTSPSWIGTIEPPPEAAAGAEGYKGLSARVLASLEQDVFTRALATGMVVGVSRSRFLDLLTILSAALELQLNVLARLGKKPSLGTWAQLWRRAGASLFLNTYLNREEAFELKLALRKAAMGIEAAAAGAEDMLDRFADADWDQYLDDLLPEEGGVAGAFKMGAETLLTGSGLVLGVGAQGVRQLARFIDHAAQELLEGVLASGILYYHGMAIAADCLALDRVHREGPEMNRSVRDAIGGATRLAGQLLRRQVIGFRTALKQKRRQAIEQIRKVPGRSWDGIGAGATRMWQGARGRFGRGGREETPGGSTAGK